MKTWEKEQFLQKVLKNKTEDQVNSQLSAPDISHPKYDEFDPDEDYEDGDDDGLYSHDEGELDQSFDDSDLQNKDPGTLLSPFDAISSYLTSVYRSYTVTAD
jgi:hypothetical protein